MKSNWLTLGFLFLNGCAWLPLNRSPSGVPLSQERTMIWAHRGASGELPEHTLESYTLAIEQGAHAIELDLVPSQDGKLFVRHENELSETTNVSAVFPERKRTKNVEGRRLRGWFTEDFKASELKLLKAKQRVASRDQRWNNRFSLTTFEEVLRFLEEKNNTRQRQGLSKVGLIIELKHPSYFRAANLWVEDLFLSELNRFYDSREKVHQKNGVEETAAEPAIWVQCFERETLVSLRKWVGQSTRFKIKFLQLIDDLDKPLPEENAAGLKSGQERFTNYRDLIDPEEMTRVKEYADGYGFAKDLVFEQDKEGNWSPTGIVDLAHRNGLEVHVYTFRRENVVFENLEKKENSFNSNFLGEYLPFLRLGVDALFTDYPKDGNQAILHSQEQNFHDQ